MCVQVNLVLFCVSMSALTHQTMKLVLGGERKNTDHTTLSVNYDRIPSAFFFSGENVLCITLR